jgi:hypothetical protein
LGNYLKVDKKQQVIALLQLGWSYRRIESETAFAERRYLGTTICGVQNRPRCSPAWARSRMRFPRISKGVWRVKPGQSVPRLRVKSGQSVLRLAGATALVGGDSP